MKSLLCSLAVALVIGLGSSASAAVFMHAGPVNVAVGGRPAHHHVHHRPVAVRPVPVAPVAPVVMAPRPVFVPAPVVAGSVNTISPRERQEIREEARELRQEIRQAGAVVSPRERREIREEARELGREIRQAVRD
jgi:16S rRNA A1518/A1519 N6-dimethyltransferase RsmA/KsgA/DIM1 with predicted DNA glycosylase/AP lyase activity